MLGITQGVTEFAPVSSSGHLIIVPWLFDWPILADPNLNKTFDVALHLGTLVGALVYFRHDVARYARAAFHSISTRRIGSTDERLAWALVVGTIPAIIVGATLESFIQDELGQPWLIAVMLVVFGVVLYAVDRIAASRRHLEDLGVRDGLVLGVAQALALQPGVSRSGVTMTAARVLTFDRETAARFSFLLSLPVIAGRGPVQGTGSRGRGDPARDGRAVRRGDRRLGRERLPGDRVPAAVPAGPRLRVVPVDPRRGRGVDLRGDRDRGSPRDDLSDRAQTPASVISPRST